MRYIDSQSRTAENAYGTWLKDVVDHSAQKVRWQSAFFNSDPLALFAAQLTRVSRSGGVIALVGSNAGVTAATSIRDLADVLDLPQPNSKIGVVYVGGGIYHPKTFHVLRSDGSEAAYVGSANLTGSGVAVHVEAGLVLDTRDGDSQAVIARIAQAVEEWFDQPVAGLHLVQDSADVASLVSQGVLDAQRPAPPPKRQPSASRSGSSQQNPANLRRLIRIPQLRRASPPISTPQPMAVAGMALAGYPPQILFAPGAVGPTKGSRALTGKGLPTGAPGLVFRLTRDSTKRFEDRPGTSYVSLPLETLESLAFGLGGNDLPRTEFQFRSRYLYAGGEIRAAGGATNITMQGVGPNPGATHRNLRLLVPAVVGQLASQLRSAGLHRPRDGDLAFIDWPTQQEPVVSLTFVEPNTTLEQDLQDVLQAAVRDGSAVGRGSAAWLPLQYLPPW